MAMRIVADNDKPSVAIEIPLEHPLPDYDLEQVEQPTPRDVDAILVSQGFRDLVDDARGVLMDLIANPPAKESSDDCELDLSNDAYKLDLTQLTGAICPGDDEVYRPGLWIVISDKRANQKAPCPAAVRAHITAIVREFVKRLGLD